MLEHVLSDELKEALIAAKLGQPTHDPHGEPIPCAELVLEVRRASCLASLEAGATGVLARGSDAEPGDAALPRRARDPPGARFEGSSASLRRPAVVRFGDDGARPRR